MLKHFVISFKLPLILSILLHIIYTTEFAIPEYNQRCIYFRMSYFCNSYLYTKYTQSIVIQVVERIHSGQFHGHHRLWNPYLFQQCPRSSFYLSVLSLQVEFHAVLSDHAWPSPQVHLQKHDTNQHLFMAVYNLKKQHMTSKYINISSLPNIQC